MNTKDLAKKIEYFDNCYRKGEAKISDAEYDSLQRTQKEILIIRFLISP